MRGGRVALLRQMILWQAVNVSERLARLGYIERWIMGTVTASQQILNSDDRLSNSVELAEQARRLVRGFLQSGRWISGLSKLEA